MRKLIFSGSLTYNQKIDFFRKALYALSKWEFSDMLHTNGIVPIPNSDMRKFILCTLTLFSKKQLFLKSHVCTIEMGVFSRAEYESHSPESEFRHAKINILYYPHIILKKSHFSEYPFMHYRNGGFQSCQI